MISPWDVDNLGSPQLLDTHQISYLGAGRNVLRFETKRDQDAATPIVIGDPAFDLTVPKQPPHFPPVRTQVELPDEEGQVAEWFNHLGSYFPPLSGTREEAEEVAALLGVSAWLGADALEAPLKAVHSPRILHIATHGFFLSDPTRS